MQSVWRDASRWGVYTGAILLILALAICGQATGSDVRAVPCTIKAPGETGESAIILDEVSQGVSELEVQVTLMDPAIGEITAVRFPSWAGLNSKSGVPSDSVTLKAADTGKKIDPGDREVVFATLTIRGDKPGSCDVRVKVIGVKDEGGVLYPLPGRNGTLVVMGPAEPAGTQGTPLPTPYTTSPTLIIPTASPKTPPVNQPGLLPTVVIPTATLAAVTSTTVPQEITFVPTYPTSSEVDVTDTADKEDESGSDTTAETMVMQGALCLDSNPRGALIMVNGRESGITPACLNLEDGTYQIVLSTGDGFTWQGDISVIAGQTLSLPPFVLEKPLKYVINAGVGPHGSVFPSGSVKFREGEAAEFHFTADPGYRLDKVQVDGVWQDPSSPIRFEAVTADHVVFGTFTEVPPPVADFSANVTDGFAPLAIGFNDLSTGDISARLWHFGDGSSSSDPSPEHFYGQPGNYTVSLDVCGEGGCNISRRVGFVTVLEREPLVADFAANTTCGPAPLMVQFQDLSTGGPDSWAWDFGDGSISTDPSPAHLFAVPGIYNVHLTVSKERYTVSSEKEGLVNVTPAVIGGSVGYFIVRCPVDGARIFLDGQFQGVAENGTLIIPVYVTATPFQTIYVKADGFLPYSASLATYPDEDESVTIEISMLSIREAGSGGPGRFQVPDLHINGSHSITSLLT